jgi:AraC-like DNA-binding protein
MKITPYNASSLLVNSEILLGSIEAASELDIKITSILNRHLIPIEELRNPRGFLSFQQVVRFLNDVANENHCPLFGYHVGRHQPPLRFGHIAQLPRLCSTLGEAIEKGLQYSQVYNQASQWVAEEDGEFILFKRFHREDYTDPLVQLHTLAATIMNKAIGDMMQGAKRLAGVYLSHAEPEGSDTLRKYFGAPIYFNHSFNGFSIHQNATSIPIPTANPKLLSILETQLNQLIHTANDNNDSLCRTKQLIKNHLGTNICNIEGISQAMALHPRTLQRDLESHNTTFRDILISIRQETAENYLKFSDISIIELSEILGYQNSTAFNRAFKNQTGLPPKIWQQSNKKYNS